jgi:hypothetical protein
MMTIKERDNDVDDDDDITGMRVEEKRERRTSRQASRKIEFLGLLKMPLFSHKK